MRIMVVGGNGFVGTKLKLLLTDAIKKERIEWKSGITSLPTPIKEIYERQTVRMRINTGGGKKLFGCCQKARNFTAIT